MSLLLSTILFLSSLVLFFSSLPFSTIRFFLVAGALPPIAPTLDDLFPAFKLKAETRFASVHVITVCTCTILIINQSLTHQTNEGLYFYTITIFPWINARSLFPRGRRRLKEAGVYSRPELIYCTHFELSNHRRKTHEQPPLSTSSLLIPRLLTWRKCRTTSFSSVPSSPRSSLRRRKRVRIATPPPASIWGPAFISIPGQNTPSV